MTGSKRRGLLVLASLFEPFGLMPLEAALVGIPVVVGNRGGTTESMREIRDDGDGDGEVTRKDLRFS